MTTFGGTRAVAASPITAASAADGPAPAAVKIDNFTFSPNPVTVAVGTPVRWTNHDDVPHTVVADDKSFKSKALDTDDAFTYTFSKPGTYSYFCGLHPRMTGKVVVK
jgi:plastocyanin